MLVVLLLDEGIWQNIWALIETPKLILVSSKITLALHCQAPDKKQKYFKDKNNHKGVLSLRSGCKGCLKICFIFVIPLKVTL